MIPGSLLFAGEIDTKTGDYGKDEFADQDPELFNTVRNTPSAPNLGDQDNDDSNWDWVNDREKGKDKPTSDGGSDPEEENISKDSPEEQPKPSEMSKEELLSAAKMARDELDYSEEQTREEFPELSDDEIRELYPKQEKAASGPKQPTTEKLVKMWKKYGGKNIETGARMSEEDMRDSIRVAKNLYKDDKSGLSYSNLRTAYPEMPEGVLTAFAPNPSKRKRDAFDEAYEKSRSFERIGAKPGWDSPDAAHASIPRPGVIDLGEKTIKAVGVAYGVVEPVHENLEMKKTLLDE